MHKKLFISGKKFTFWSQSCVMDCRVLDVITGMIYAWRVLGGIIGRLSMQSCDERTLSPFDCFNINWLILKVMAAYKEEISGSTRIRKCKI